MALKSGISILILGCIQNVFVDESLHIEASTWGVVITKKKVQKFKCAPKTFSYLVNITPDFNL